MMAPSVVMRDDDVELVLGSAGSNRIRSALLQTIVGVVDRGLLAREAVDAPRVHFEDGILYAEPGIDVEQLGGEGSVVAFGALRLALARWSIAPQWVQLRPAVQIGALAGLLVTLQLFSWPGLSPTFIYFKF